MMLYPVSRSGSASRKKRRKAISSSGSVAQGTTCAPTMGAQLLRVNTTRTNGSSMLRLVLMQQAIWMTGSSSGLGKWPLRPAHSMSNDIRRSGATLIHSPSLSCACTAR